MFSQIQGGAEVGYSCEFSPEYSYITINLLLPHSVYGYPVAQWSWHIKVTMTLYMATDYLTIEF